MCGSSVCVCLLRGLALFTLSCQLPGSRRWPAVWVLLGALFWVHAMCACVRCATLSSPKQPRVSTWCQGGFLRPQFAPAIARWGVSRVCVLWVVFVCVSLYGNLVLLGSRLLCLFVWFAFSFTARCLAFGVPPAGRLLLCRLARWPPRAFPLAGLLGCGGCLSSTGQSLSNFSGVFGRPWCFVARCGEGAGGAGRGFFWPVFPPVVWSPRRAAPPSEVGVYCCLPVFPSLLVPVCPFGTRVTVIIKRAIRCRARRFPHASSHPPLCVACAFPLAFSGWGGGPRLQQLPCACGGPGRPCRLRLGFVGGPIVQAGSKSSEFFSPSGFFGRDRCAMRAYPASDGVMYCAHALLHPPARWRGWYWRPGDDCPFRTM
jgi:hypothetical protein